MGEKTRILIVAGGVASTLTEQRIIIELGYELVATVFSGEAALKIRDLHQIPVIFVIDLGAMEPSEVGGFSKPEGIGFVSKPFTAEELESGIKRLID